MAEKIKTGLDAEDRKAVAQALSRMLADTYAVYLKTHGFHWNVRGPNFSSLHALFMEQYTEMWQAIDTVAERIRALGELAPQGYGAFGNLSSIKDGDPEGDSQSMLQALTSDHETVIATCREALTLAQKADDEASAGIITDRLEAHEKHAWMLRATLGGK
ncbi:MAG: Dps family protein [Phenylobacterium sp.]|uniref:Dps family protein n=1 Tax=Phenylobacterium sp. TaxID=1871053 RepID=UPI00273252E3|nr:Dps family protein [Phenylobacterium sp.]MDP1643364.1 Dps family protein [Phenylobacterium sp.]MDP3118554.1 Dps family protein [Phenylobacterium sp.]